MEERRTPRKIVPLSEDFEFYLLCDPSSIVYVGGWAHLHDKQNMAIPHTLHVPVLMEHPSGNSTNSVLYWED